jgi:hypothetical protein
MPLQKGFERLHGWRSEYLVRIRKELRERTGVEHCAECQEETRVFEILAKGMRALGISTVRDIPADMTFQEMMTLRT